MARTVISFSATGLQELVNAINTALAPLTAHIFLSVSIECQDIARRTGIEWVALIDYEDGGAALSDPFILNFFENKVLTDAVQLAQTFLDTTADYTTPSRLCIVDPTRLVPNNNILIFSNADAGAGANWSAG